MYRFIYLFDRHWESANEHSNYNCSEIHWNQFGAWRWCVSQIGLQYNSNGDDASMHALTHTLRIISNGIRQDSGHTLRVQQRMLILNSLYLNLKLKRHLSSKLNPANEREREKNFKCLLMHIIRCMCGTKSAHLKMAIPSDCDSMIENWFMHRFTIRTNVELQQILTYT